MWEQAKTGFRLIKIEAQFKIVPKRALTARCLKFVEAINAVIFD